MKFKLSCTVATLCKSYITKQNILQHEHTVYAVIFEGCKFHGFHCKLAEHKILILEKKQ